MLPTSLFVLKIILVFIIQEVCTIMPKKSFIHSPPRDKQMNLLKVMHICVFFFMFISTCLQYIYHSELEHVHYTSFSPPLSPLPAPPNFGSPLICKSSDSFLSFHFFHLLSLHSLPVLCISCSIHTHICTHIHIYICVCVPGIELVTLCF